MNSKQSRVIIVTGSTRGIGLETAGCFLKNGDKVVVFCRHREHVQQAFKYLSGFGHPANILSLSADVRLPGESDKVISRTLERFGHLDVLVNNAGVAVYKLLEETSSEEWDLVMQTNLKGPFLFIRSVLPIFKKQNSGIIINISSILGIEARSRYSAYCASKFGLISLTQNIALETKNTDIKSYAVLPHGVDTELYRQIHPLGDYKHLLSAQFVAEKIFTLAEGKKKSGFLKEIKKNDK